jgi:hypothetical protein
MSEAVGAISTVSGPEFVGIPVPAMPPVVVLAPAMQGASLLAPQQYLHFYSDQQWEEFTAEWVRALKHPYIRVLRMGGAGDRGADIAACLTPQGTDGDWHCYQCKHYADALRPADAWPEIAKIFQAAVKGVYRLPVRYIFVAPKIGPTLTRWLVSPGTLKAEFLKAWDKPDSQLGSGWDPAERAAVEALVRSTDFSMFEAADMEFIVQLHAGTPHHARRFPVVLKPRPPVSAPPPKQARHEALYIKKLLAAYNEKHGLSLCTLQEARAHARTSAHLIRQREAFYSAEALRVFARDSVPDETYDALKSDLYDAVIEVEERDDYNLGHERLDAVLHTAANHNPNPGNILTAVVTVNDRKGMCHQLANDDRLTWCKDQGAP